MTQSLLVAGVGVHAVAGADELRAARRFQAQQYLLAKYVTERDLDDDGVLPDPWVPFSDYFVARIDGQIVGTCRMIRPSPMGLQAFSKAELHPETLDHFATIPAWACTEISALATVRDTKSKVATALYARVWAESIWRRHVYMVGFMDKRLVRVLRSLFGSPFEPIGPPIIYLGSETVPVVMHVPSSIEVYKERRPDLYAILRNSVEAPDAIDDYVIDLREHTFAAPEFETTRQAI